jgi:hypothetical protein
MAGHMKKQPREWISITREWISVFQDRWRWRRRDGRFIELIDAFDPEENVVGLFCIGEPS